MGWGWGRRSPKLLYLSKVYVATLSSIAAIAFKVGVMVGDAGFDQSVWLGGEGTGGMRIILDHDTGVVMPPMEGGRPS